MPLSLFEPHFNGTLFQNSYHLKDVSSSFPAPVAPDGFNCDDWYASPHPPTVEDCRTAFSLLPTGTADEPFSYHFNDDDPNQLPLTVAHGTCEIVFQTSGESASQEDPIIINPTDIRNMAGWVIDQCVAPQKIGGAIARNAKKATDWVLDPQSEWYTDHFPKESTYLSMHVWNFGPQDVWNPGNQDPQIAFNIAKYVDDTVERMPTGHNKNILDQRVDNLWDWSGKMRMGGHQNWWEPPPQNHQNH